MIIRIYQLSLLNFYLFLINYILYFTILFSSQIFSFIYIFIYLFIYLLIYTFIQIVDTIRDLGVEAFVSTDSEVSFSPSKSFKENDTNGTVLLYQRSVHGQPDIITVLSELSPTLSKDMKKSLSSLWKACLVFKMFILNREENILLQCKYLIEDSDLSGSVYTESQSQSQTSTQSQYYSVTESERIHRLIVMESALAAGLGSVLSEYVTVQVDSTNRFTRGKY